MELAGAATAEIVRAKKNFVDQLQLNDQIEDILITMKKQHHLVRLCHENDSVFSYLILDREQGSLALARTQLRTIEKSLRNKDLSLESL